MAKHKEAKIYPYLPVSQIPTRKRIYTKVHSLNLSLLGFYPESTKVMTGQWKEEGEEDHEKEHRKGPVRDADFPSTPSHCQDWKPRREIYYL